MSGVQNPDRNPIQAALAANQKRLNRLEEAKAKQTWEKKMAKLTISDWQEPALTVGADRYVTGIRRSAGKRSAFWQQQVPKLETLKSSIRAMPDATEADREKRMLENLRKMKGTKQV